MLILCNRNTNKGRTTLVIFAQFAVFICWNCKHKDNEEQEVSCPFAFQDHTQKQAARGEADRLQQELQEAWKI